MSVAQLQQIVLNLQQQIQQITQLLSQRGQNACIAEGQNFTDASKQCCAGLTKRATEIGCPSGTNCTIVPSYNCFKSTTICGNGVCESGETAANCPADCEAPVSQNKCSVDSDCVSDSGTCHKCFNKTWWAAQSASAKRQWMCDGIGDSLCKCQSGTCAAASICGDRTCDTAKGETATNCSADCGTNRSCIGENIRFTDASKQCCAGLTKRATEIGCPSGTNCTIVPSYNCFKSTTICGDGNCDTAKGETSINCSKDCPPKVGGNCSYKPYMGTCVIKSGNNYTFTPTESVDISQTNPTSQQINPYSGSLNNITGTLPSNLTVGSSFPCVLNILSEGICTPFFMQPAYTM